MENETNTAVMKEGAKDQTFKKEKTKISLFDKIYYAFMIISMLALVLGMGSIIADIILR